MTTRNPLIIIASIVGATIIFATIIFFFYPGIAFGHPIWGPWPSTKPATPAATPVATPVVAAATHVIPTVTPQTVGVQQCCPTTTPTTAAAPTPVVGCPKESTMLTPQGKANKDGLFSIKDLVAPNGFPNIIFDGQLRPDQIHVFLVFDSQVPELTFVQGTVYAVCGDATAIAVRIANEKANRNPGLEIQVRDLRGGGNKLIRGIN